MNIPNLVSKFRNAINAKKTKIYLKNSKSTLTFLNILKKHKFICAYYLKTNNKVEVYLKYNFKKSCILNILCLDKNTLPLYLSVSDLWKFDKDIGIVILNTSKGIITHKNALKLGVGGKALAYII